MPFTLTHMHRLPDPAVFFDRIPYFRDAMRRRRVVVTGRGTIREERETTIGTRGVATTSLECLVLELEIVARGCSLDGFRIGW